MCCILSLVLLCIRLGKNRFDSMVLGGWHLLWSLGICLICLRENLQSVTCGLVRVQLRRLARSYSQICMAARMVSKGHRVLALSQMIVVSMGGVLP